MIYIYKIIYLKLIYKILIKSGTITFFNNITIKNFKNVIYFKKIMMYFFFISPYFEKNYLFISFFIYLNNNIIIIIYFI